MLYLGMRLLASEGDAALHFYPRLEIRDGGAEIRKLEAAELMEALPERGCVKLAYNKSAPYVEGNYQFVRDFFPDKRLVVLQLPDLKEGKLASDPDSPGAMKTLPLQDALPRIGRDMREPELPQSFGLYPLLRCPDAREALSGRPVHPLALSPVEKTLAGQEVLLWPGTDYAIGPVRLPEAPDGELEFDLAGSERHYFFELYRKRPDAECFFTVEGADGRPLYKLAATKRMDREPRNFLPDEVLLRDPEESIPAEGGGRYGIPADIAELRLKRREALSRQAGADVLEAQAKLERARGELEQLLAQRQEILDTFRREMDEQAKQVERIAKTALHAELEAILLDAATPSERSGAREEDAALERQLVELAQGNSGEDAGADALDPDGAPEEIAEELVRRFEESRAYDENAILNLLICLTQGFLTVFSGAPGTGKTSVCRILAHVLGLDADEEDGERLARFVNVSVERGWASKKDFVGYYNPLTKRFDKANGAVYRALHASDIEARRKLGDNLPLSVILLDEANLSPMEYYWADFMRAFDNCGDAVIPLSEYDQFRVSKSLRFVATINNDHTTENLSPRLVDRAWIITLPWPKEPRYVGFERYYRPVPLRALRRAFDIERGGAPIELPEEVDALLREIYQQCREELDVRVSGRPELDIRGYCRAAALRFSPEDAADPGPWEGGAPQAPEQEAVRVEGWRVAVDYAVQQKLLPKLQGSGDAYGKSLIQFRETLRKQRLFHSARLLDEIIRRGEGRMQYYQFFA